MDTIYLIGQPGSGKTTLTKEFQKNWAKINLYDKPFKYIEHETTDYGKVYTLGWGREHFGGTDTLGNTVINHMAQFYKDANEKGATIFGEGDRLANTRFFELAENYGTLHLFYLTTDDEEAERRRQERSSKTGKEQNPSWVKGRATKHQNLAKRFNAVPLPGDKSPSQITEIMADYLYREKGNA
jgi:thymidylate kinase